MTARLIGICALALLLAAPAQAERVVAGLSPYARAITTNFYCDSLLRYLSVPLSSPPPGA